jgi:hypothetical protein
MTIRPLHLLITFWGPRYRDYLINFCLPSLLAPRNLPLLEATYGHKFFFATTEEDWKAVHRLPIIERLGRHMEPVHVRIDSPRSAEYAAVIHREQSAFRILLEAAYDRTALASMLSPDVLVPDGFIETLLQKIDDGYQLILCPSLRQVESETLAELANLGIISPKEQRSQTAGSIVIPKRIAARLMVVHLHPELFPFEEGATGQPLRPPFRFWRSEQGLILHTFYGTPVLMDFANVPFDHTSCLDDAHTFESTYVFRNFASCTRIHIVRDSDELGLLSLTPGVTVERKQPPAKRFRSLCSVRRSYITYTRGGRDRVRDLLSRSVTRWHGYDLQTSWNDWEASITTLVDYAIGDYWQGKTSPWRRILFGCGSAPFEIVSSLQTVGQRLARALTGDQTAQLWFAWVFKRHLAAIMRRPFHASRPPV